MTEITHEELLVSMLETATKSMEKLAGDLVKFRDGVVARAELVGFSIDENMDDPCAVALRLIDYLIVTRDARN